MSALDCDVHFDAQPGQRDDRNLMIEPWKLFGCDESEESTEAKESDDFRAANPSVTQKFCHPDRTTPLSSDEGAVLWERLRRNGYAPCSIKAGSKYPVGKEWQKKAFREVPGWMARAPGTGLVCGNLDPNGKPAPVAGSLIVVDCDFRLMKAVADYDGLACEALLKKQPNATRLRKIADHLRAIAPTLVEKDQSLSRLLCECPTLAKLRASALERGRAESPNFALLFRNDGNLGNATPQLYLPIEVGGESVLIRAFGIDRLASGKQLVSYHLHPDTGRPWLWESRSPEDTPLAELPQINAMQWQALWREIASAGATLGLIEEGASAANPFVGNEATGAFGLEPNIPPGKSDRLPPPVETMRAMLEHLAARDYFERREDVAKDADGRILKIGWLETGMALKPAYGDEVGLDLWAVTHIDEKARKDAPMQWESFASEPHPGHVTIGLIIKAAQHAGFVFARSTVDATEPGYVSYGPFTMDADGLTKEILKKTGKTATVETAWICAPLEVLGACRDPQGCAWGKQLRFRDADNRTHMRHVSDAALQGEPATLCATLAHEGLRINRSKQREFAEYLSAVGVDARVTIVNRTGWHEIGEHRVFTLPAETIAAGLGEAVVLDQVANLPYEARGTLEDWKQGIGALTAGHALPVFMISAALAGPLAHLVGAEGGGFHIFGPSSIGKSAMLQAAASVWGRGGTPGYVRSWRATANGLEGAAASATDTCLVLDELGVGEARDVAAAIYTLTNGMGKARAARDGSAREPRCWRVFVLSSGELPVETKLGEDRGRKIRAGQLVRLLDIPADRALGFGAFDHAGDYDDAGKLADAIKHAAATAYGTAGPEFVRRLVAANAKKIASAKKLMASFVRSAVDPGASEQTVRAAKQFALIALAGELATGLGITPWAQGRILNCQEFINVKGFGWVSKGETHDDRFLGTYQGGPRASCAGDGHLSAGRDSAFDFGWGLVRRR